MFSIIIIIHDYLNIEKYTDIKQCACVQANSFMLKLILGEFADALELSIQNYAPHHQRFPAEGKTFLMECFKKTKIESHP